MELLLTALPFLLLSAFVDHGDGGGDDGNGDDNDNDTDADGAAAAQRGLPEPEPAPEPVTVPEFVTEGPDADVLQVLRDAEGDDTTLSVTADGDDALLSEGDTVLARIAGGALTGFSLDNVVVVVEA